MKKYIYTCDDMIDRKGYGGKAYWLKWLYDNGYNIPTTFFIQAIKKQKVNKVISNFDFINDLLEKIFSRLEKVAFRSSAVSEDDDNSSKAGNFITCLNITTADEAIKAYKRIVESIKVETDFMGVVVQEMVESKYSGVVFSSDPISADKNRIILSYTKGLGESLVSGANPGNDIIIDSSTLSIIEGAEKGDLNLDLIIKIASIAKKIEKQLNIPIDIEWAIDSRNGDVVLLQCRPITTIFLKKNDLVKIANKNICNIDSRLTSSDKVNLRLIAEKKSIHISDAYLLTCNCASSMLPINEINIDKSPYYRGYSTVILYPKQIDKKIIRSFVGNKMNVSKLTKCHRYCIRQFPKHDNLHACLNELYTLAREQMWICSIIIQEIYDPLYTGILKKVSDKYIIEITKGHFAPKGIVPMSTYIIDENRVLINKNEIKQYTHIGIIEGCTIDYLSADDDEKLVSITCHTINKIIDTVGQLCDENIVVEFGLLEEENKDLLPYLIDCVRNEKKDTIVATDIANNVLSSGIRVGKLQKIDLGNIQDSLDIHFYNEINNTIVNNQENLIIFAELPSIKLLEFLDKYDHSKIAFVFEQGSLLCHLSVLLREYGIPAIIGYSKYELKEGETYYLNTNILGRNKLIQI